MGLRWVGWYVVLGVGSGGPGVSGEELLGAKSLRQQHITMAWALCCLLWDGVSVWPKDTLCHCEKRWSFCYWTWWLSPQSEVLLQFHCLAIFLQSLVYSKFLRTFRENELLSAWLKKKGSFKVMLGMHSFTFSSLTQPTNSCLIPYTVLFPIIAFATRAGCRVATCDSHKQLGGVMVNCVFRTWGPLAACRKLMGIYKAHTIVG